MLTTVSRYFAIVIGLNSARQAIAVRIALLLGIALSLLLIDGYYGCRLVARTSGPPAGGPVLDRPEDVRAYWTPERMRLASGAPMPKVSDQGAGFPSVPCTNDGPSVGFPATSPRTP